MRMRVLAVLALCSVGTASGCESSGSARTDGGGSAGEDGASDGETGGASDATDEDEGDSLSEDVSDDASDSGGDAVEAGDTEDDGSTGDAVEEDGRLIDDVEEDIEFVQHESIVVPGVNAEEVMSVDTHATATGELLVWYTVDEAGGPVTRLWRQGQASAERIGTTSNAMVERLQVVTDLRGVTWLVWAELAASVGEAEPGPTLYSRRLDNTEPSWSSTVPTGWDLRSFDATESYTFIGPDSTGGVAVFVSLTNGVETVVQSFGVYGYDGPSVGDFSNGAHQDSRCTGEFDCDPMRGAVASQTYIRDIETTGNWFSIRMPLTFLGMERTGLMVFTGNSETGLWEPVGDPLATGGQGLPFSIELGDGYAFPSLVWLERSETGTRAFLASYIVAEDKWRVTEPELVRTEGGEIVDLEMHPSSAGMLVHYLERNGDTTYRRTWAPPGVAVLEDSDTSHEVIGRLRVDAYRYNALQVLVPTRVEGAVVIDVYRVADLNSEVGSARDPVEGEE